VGGCQRGSPCDESCGRSRRPETKDIAAYDLSAAVRENIKIVLQQEYNNLGTQDNPIGPLCVPDCTRRRILTRATCGPSGNRISCQRGRFRFRTRTRRDRWSARVLSRRRGGPERCHRRVTNRPRHLLLSRYLTDSVASPRRRATTDGPGRSSSSATGGCGVSARYRVCSSVPAPVSWLSAHGSGVTVSRSGSPKTSTAPAQNSIDTRNANSRSTTGCPTEFRSHSHPEGDPRK